MTAIGEYGAKGKRRHLVAILTVIKRFESHDAAAEWYRRMGLPVPSNCMVTGNRPEPLRRTMGAPGSCACGAGTLAAWDRRYHTRAHDYPVFLVCRGWKEMVSPPVVDEETALMILGTGKRVRLRLPLPLSAAELRAFKRISTR
jgi:hypothetical protein